jgi:hypothetical protein
MQKAGPAQFTQFVLRCEDEALVEDLRIALFDDSSKRAQEGAEKEEKPRQDVFMVYGRRSAPPAPPYRVYVYA